jgi:hypothetical membrane protein
MENIKLFYEKVNGSYFFFVGVAISIVAIIISIALYIAGGAPFSILTNFVSDLGAISAPNNAFIAFNTGLILNSILSPFGALFLFLYFKNTDIKQKAIIQFWFITNIISAITTFLVALFPEDTLLGPHAVAAIITFIFGMVSYCIYGIIVILIDNIAKYHSIPGFVLAAINMVFMLLWVFSVPLFVITFFEWLVLFGGWGFGIYLGFFALNAK